MGFSVTKNSSLKSFSDIEMLFKSGKKLSSPIMSLYYKESSVQGLKIAFSVGKKKHKLAVNRNKIKRLMREAFRLNSLDSIEPSISYIFLFVYFGAEVPKYTEVDKTMNSLLLSFKNKVLC